MKINLYQLLLLFFVLTINPIVGGNLNMLSTLLLFTLMVSATLLGSLVTNYFEILDKKSLAHYAFNFFLGSSFLFVSVPFLNMVSANNAIYFNIGLFVILLFVLFYKGKIITLEFVFKKRETIEVLVLMVLFFYISGVPEYISPSSVSNRDAIYFTTLVASLKSSPTLFTLNEMGSHINYQLFSFFSPTVISKYTILPSHISLWNIGMPFYIVMFGLLLTKLFSFNLVQNKQIKIFSYIGVLLFIGLLPLHLKNILSLKWEWYLPGTGSLLPGGNPPVTLAISITLIIIIIIRKHFISKPIERKYFLLVAFLTGLVLPIKVAAFPGIACFVVLFYFFVTRNIGKGMLLSLLILTVGLVGYKISKPISGFTQIILEPGYLLEYFGNSTSMFKNVIITASFLSVFVMVKLVIFLYYRFKSTRTRVMDNIIMAAILSLLITLLFPLLLRLHVVDNNMNVIQDLTFDSLQFPRFGFFIITVVGAMVFLEIYDPKKHIIFNSAIYIYCSLVFIGWVSYSFNVEGEERKEYYDIVEREMDSVQQPQLYATFASNEYMPQVFVADDYKKFYVTSNRNKGGYAMTRENIYRWGIMENLEKALLENKSKEIEFCISQLKKDNVTAIIFNPSNLKALNKNNLEFFENSDNLYLKKVR